MTRLEFQRNSCGTRREAAGCGADPAGGSEGRALAQVRGWGRGLTLIGSGLHSWMPVPPQLPPHWLSCFQRSRAQPPAPRIPARRSCAERSPQTPTPLRLCRPGPLGQSSAGFHPFPLLQCSSHTSRPLCAFWTQGLCTCRSPFPECLSPRFPVFPTPRISSELLRDVC